MVALLMLGIGLAMDSFAVSVAVGASRNRIPLIQLLKMSLIFAVFQGGMPVIGFLASHLFPDSYAAWDHWLAFGLLSIVGGKMVWESMFSEAESNLDISRLFVLCTLGLATSLDALAVGFTLSAITDQIPLAIITIGLSTLVLSSAGPTLGRLLGKLLREKAELGGGILLILLGVKTLIEHLIHH